MSQTLNDREEFVPCPRCKIEVKRKNLKKHSKKHTKKHNNIDETTVTMRPRLCDMSPTKRRRYLDSLDRPEKEYTQDIYSRGMVVSGGAYGLGKNRRH